MSLGKRDDGDSPKILRGHFVGIKPYIAPSEKSLGCGSEEKSLNHEVPS